MKNKFFFSILILLFNFLNLNGQYYQLVNPMIGTGGHGHCFPGPTYPFGMVQLSPDSRLEGWDGCSGYHNSDSSIYGFSHTHLSGTGVPDLCDILIQPGSGKMAIQKNFIQLPDISSRFKKQNEIAEVGLYSNYLDRYKVKVRLTVTPRTGIHEYRFDHTKGEKWIAIDLKHRDQLIDWEFSKISDTRISGYRRSSSWAKDQWVFFDVRSSSKIKRYLLNKDSSQLICYFDEDLKTLRLQCAISAVDQKGASNNLDAEWTELEFDEIVIRCRSAWDRLLQRVKIEDKNWDKDQFTIFYTALYHSCIHPSLFQDADGRYRGMDQKIHQGDPKHPRYSIFSLWDTYRAAHPLYQLVFPEYNYDFILSFLGQFDECGRLPVWELAANETYCMIGNHSIPVLSYAWSDQNPKYKPDYTRILNAVEKTLSIDFSALETFKTMGFISPDKASESVSKTIENSLDFAALSILTGKSLPQSSYYQNLYNPNTGFFQAKLNHSFVKPFEPSEVNFHYTEANAWQYLFGAHHDPKGMMKCFSYNSNENPQSILETRLDSLFLTQMKLSGREQSDITGLIGQYAHGNEPSHHVAFLYNYAGRPDKTESYVSKIRRTLYTNSAEGLSGNEDCGQMSAWYVWTSLGFYPMLSIMPVLDPVRPAAGSVVIYPPDQKPILIIRDDSKGKKFLGQITQNGKPIHNPIRLRPGDKIIFEGSDSKSWKGYDLDSSFNELYFSNCLPFVSKGERVFSESQKIELSSMNSRPIQYFFKSLPQQINIYNKAIEINQPAEICFSQEGDTPSSNWPCAKFGLKPLGLEINLSSEYAPVYAAGGKDALIDGLHGSSDFRDGMWQGYFNKDVTLEMNLTQAQMVNKINIGFLQDQKSWILFPNEIQLKYSLDGIHWKEKNIRHSIPQNTVEGVKNIFSFDISEPVLKIQLKCINPGPLPDWHLSKGESCWLFIDEIELTK